MTPPPSFMWWARDHTELATGPHPRISLQSEDASLSAVSSDTMVTLPAEYSPTPSTPEGDHIRHMIENASPATARHMALRLYRSMKKHGLRQEAAKAVVGRKDEEDGEEEKEELIGMDYMLRDGLVNYLRDLVKVTPPIPQQVVKFHGISCSRKIEIPSNRYETFGNKVAGFALWPLKTLFQVQRSSSKWMEVLKGVDGYIMPGSMTLLLGPQGSGKSSLLKVLAGKANVSNDADLQGAVTYNGKPAAQIRLTRLVAYINGQLNKICRHLPFLTVRETLEFARDCTQGFGPQDFTPKMRKFFAHALVEGQDPFLEYVLKILKLKDVQHKLVGDDAISESDRQKLTTAELALGTYSVMIYDQPASGSDLAATYDLVDTMRTVSRIQQSSSIMSLTQLSQDVFDLFDRLILLSEGQVLYQGPRQDVVPYFAKLGYVKPPHIECYEFLEDIAAGKGSHYGATRYTPEELMNYYKASDHYSDIERIIASSEVKQTYWLENESGLGLSLKRPVKYYPSIDVAPRQETKLVVTKLSAKVGHSGGMRSTGRVHVGDVVTAISMNKEETVYLSVGSHNEQQERAIHVHSKLKHTRTHIRLQVEQPKDEEEKENLWEQFQRPFVQTWWESTKTLINRQTNTTKRLHALIKLRLIQAIILGTLTGLLFYKLGGQYDFQQMNSVRALGFVTTISIMLINMIQLPLYMLQRPIFYKHKTQRFFRVSSYVTAHCTVNMPRTIIELYMPPASYFLAGLSLAGNGVPFFTYVALLCFVAYFGSSIIFFLSSISTIPAKGNALAGLLVSMFLLFSGFVIYPSKIPTCWKWVIHVNPLHWVNVSFCRSQFLADYTDQCSDHLDQLQFCNQFPKTTVGEAYLRYYELYVDAKRPWLPFIILVGWIVATNLFTLLGLKKIKFREDIDQEKYYGSLHNDINPADDSSATSVPKREDVCVDIHENKIGLPVKRMILVFEGISFIRQDEGSKERVSVFSNITGSAKPQQMVALLGGTRTCWTTLSKCLAGRLPLTSGDLHANNSRVGNNTFARLVGYVEQHLDAHQKFLTVRESLQFSAGLRLGRSVSSTDCHIHVEQLLSQLNLTSYADRLVGSLRGKTYTVISKKTAIAVELAANPSILLLEEPISDVDGSAATCSILTSLSHIAYSSRRVIIASLTQPNARILLSFHIALILTTEGHQAYFGPVRVTKQPDPEFCSIETLINHYEELFTPPSSYSTTYPAPYSTQAALVLMRTQRLLWRNVQYTYGRVLGCIVIGLLMGSLFYQVKYKDTLGATSRSLYIYMQVILIGVISATNIIPQLGRDKQAYFREQRARMYLPILYPISWAAGEIPYSIITTLSIVAIGNGMAGIATGSIKQLLMYWLTLLVFTLYVTYFGMMTVFLAPNLTVAAFAVSIVSSLWISASGVVVVLSDMRRFYRWMYWGNPFQYAMSVLTSISFYCDTIHRASSCPKLSDGDYVWDRLRCV